MADRSYDSIPRQGEHQGGEVREEASTNVRAQEAAPPPVDEEIVKSSRAGAADPESEFSGGIIQFSHRETDGLYRIRRWRSEPDTKAADEFEELEQLPGGEPMTGLYEQLPDGPMFVVFENSDSGEVFFDADSDLGGDWTGDGRFDQVTIFRDEQAAAAYAASQQE